jgi:hypothetical protein
MKKITEVLVELPDMKTSMSEMSDKCYMRNFTCKDLFVLWKHNKEM